MPLTKPATCMVNTPRRERQHKENTQVHQGRYAPLLGLQIEMAYTNMQNNNNDLRIRLNKMKPELEADYDRLTAEVTDMANSESTTMDDLRAKIEEQNKVHRALTQLAELKGHLSYKDSKCRLRLCQNCDSFYEWSQSKICPRCEGALKSIRDECCNGTAVYKDLVVPLDEKTTVSVGWFYHVNE